MFKSNLNTPTLWKCWREVWCTGAGNIIENFTGTELREPRERSDSICEGTAGRTTFAEKFDIKGWESGFSSCHGETASAVIGELPGDLGGTYYRNGLGKFEAGETKMVHPFDANGMITAIDIQNGTALFRNRLVRTDIYLREQKENRILERGAFGTPKTGGFFANLFSLKLRDVANTNVIHWAGKLLALFEATTPHELEPDTLNTIGKVTLGGVLKPNQPFSAHPKVDANTERLVSFSSQPTGLSRTDLTVYEFDRHFNVVQQRTITIPAFVFFHDFLVTREHYIFTLSPLTFHPWSFLFGTKGPAQCIEWDPKGQSALILIPRDATKPEQYVPVDAHFSFHYANGYEVMQSTPEAEERVGTEEIEVHGADSEQQCGGECGKIVIDTVSSDRLMLSGKEGEFWKGANYPQYIPPFYLVRYTLTPKRDGSGGYTVEKSALSPTQLEFPSVNPRVVGKQHRYVFATASCDDRQSAPIQGVVKLDLGADGSGTNSQQGMVVEDRWCPAPHEFVGEVVFAPKRGAGADSAEDDGYLLSFLWDGRAQESYFVIFDAHNVSQGPLHRCKVPINVPFGLHGTFVPGLNFDHAETQRKFQMFSAQEQSAH